MRMVMTNSKWLFICTLFVSFNLNSCGPIAHVDYIKPDFSTETKLDDLIGAQKEIILNNFGPPEEVLSNQELSYYLYSGTGEALAFFIFIPAPFIGRQHCLLLEFDNKDVLKDYYLQSDDTPYDYAHCDGIIRKHGIKPASEVVLLSEVKIGNATAMWALYNRKKSRGQFEFVWLCKAAEQGDYRARWELGYLHNNGLHGVRKDLVLSVMWYGLVEADGHDPKGVDNIRKQLTPEQLIEAEHLYENWKPGQCEREISGTVTNNTN